MFLQQALLSFPVCTTEAFVDTAVVSAVASDVSVVDLTFMLHSMFFGFLGRQLFIHCFGSRLWSTKYPWIKHAPYTAFLYLSFIRGRSPVNHKDCYSRYRNRWFHIDYCFSTPIDYAGMHLLIAGSLLCISWHSGVISLFHYNLSRNKSMIDMYGRTTVFHIAAFWFTYKEQSVGSYIYTYLLKCDIIFVDNLELDCASSSSSR